MMRMTGLLWSGKLQSFMAFSATPLKSSRLIGDPVSTGLVCRQIFHGLREIAADLFGTLYGDFIGKSRCDIRLVDDGRYMAVLCGKHDRYGNEAPLENTTSGLSFFMRLTA